MRMTMMGMYDRGHEIGEVTGNGPGFDEAMRKYKARQAKQAERGKWRTSRAAYRTDKGTYCDPDWYIVDWGQHEKE